MRAAETWIAGVIASSEIPSAARRREIERELRAHADDFERDARGAGHADDEIDRMFRANLGDPRQIGGAFAWVYRRERALMRLSVFALATLAVAAITTAGTLAVQAGIAAGLGLPLPRARHTFIESLDILATVAAYIGLLSLEKLFHRRRIPKAAALLAILFASLLTASAIAGIRAPYLILGFANALFLRLVQAIGPNPAVRFGAVLLCFSLFGLILWGPSAFASWMVMGLGYQLMTTLAARIHRRLSNRLQQE